MRVFISLPAAALVLLAGCAARPGQHDPVRNNQTVSLVNSLSWTNALTGKADAMRTSWPLARLKHHTERFPLAQVKRCDAEGACSWGVLNAQRTIGPASFVAGGVALEVEVTFDVDRRQEVRHGGERMGMAIPADVSALRARRTMRQAVVLEYGKVHHIGFDFGIGYHLCVQRLNAARKPVDDCEIPYV